MKGKWSLFIGLVVGIAFLWYWSGGSKPEKSSSWRTTSATSKSGGEQRTMQEIKPTDHLPVVKNVTLSVKNADGEITPDVKLTSGAGQDLPGTDFRLRATDFYTHWNWDNGAINISFNENNPAVKVEVLRGDSVLYYQWAFKLHEYFGSSGTMGHSDDTIKELSFTLTRYEGLEYQHQHQHSEGDSK